MTSTEMNPTHGNEPRTLSPVKREGCHRLGTHAVVMSLVVALQGCAHRRILQAALPGEKRVVIDKTVQTLTAFEGERQVMQSRVSTGKAGHRTPSGNFTAGSKSLMHYSRLYDDAPMPYSVQVSGNYFIHGYTFVPNYPASHGCIRMPLGGDNPAKRFYQWVESGTPVSIVGDWSGKPRPAAPPSERSTH